MTLQAGGASGQAPHTGCKAGITASQGSPRAAAPTLPPLQQMQPKGKEAAERQRRQQDATKQRKAHLSSVTSGVPTWMAAASVLLDFLTRYTSAQQAQHGTARKGDFRGSGRRAVEAGLLPNAAVPPSPCPSSAHRCLGMR